MSVNKNINNNPLNDQQFEGVWRQCLTQMQAELPEQQFNTWIVPLEFLGVKETNALCLRAPNRFIKDWVNRQFIKHINQKVLEVSQGTLTQCVLEIEPLSQTLKTENKDGKQVLAHNNQFQEKASHQRIENNTVNHSFLTQPVEEPTARFDGLGGVQIEPVIQTAESPSSESQTFEALDQDQHQHQNQNQASKDAFVNVFDDDALFNTPINHANERVFASNQANHTGQGTQTLGNTSKSVGLVESYTFDNFVEGKSNQLARAAAQQVAENPGDAYNPFFLYGGVGLGKTHLIHAIGNEIRKNNPEARVVYLNSERFVADMVKAMQLNAINDFKRYYRSVDALLIDDIQFFAGKDHSQEEFFHTFNALLEGNHQIILTSDRYPKEINGLEERLRSRFGWGLTSEISPPDLETRVAILLKKAQESNIKLSHDSAFFIAQRIRANVRDLEGALKRVNAHARFVKQDIDIALIEEALRDLFALQDRLITMSNIQKTVAEYFKIKMADLLSKRRSRSIARPRQIAMALAKELTSHSLPEIGDSFGGRDHTTVLHACRKVAELKETNIDVAEDYKNLLRILTT